MNLGLAALPEFVIGIFLVLLFATGVFKWLPSVSTVDSQAPLAGQMRLFILPTVTLVLAVIPYITRMLRASTTEVLESEYVMMARLKGLSESRVLWHHALPNAIIPTIQVIAINIAWLAGGIVTVEYLFGFPGIGSELVDAVANRDLPVIQALVLLVAAVYVLLNLAADILTSLDQSTPSDRIAMSRSDDASLVPLEPLKTVEALDPAKTELTIRAGAPGGGGADRHERVAVEAYQGGISRSRERCSSSRSSGGSWRRTSPIPCSSPRRSDKHPQRRPGWAPTSWA